MCELLIYARELNLDICKFDFVGWWVEFPEAYRRYPT